MYLLVRLVLPQAPHLFLKWYGKVVAQPMPASWMGLCGGGYAASTAKHTRRSCLQKMCFWLAFDFLKYSPIPKDREYYPLPIPQDSSELFYFDVGTFLERFREKRFWRVGEPGGWALCQTLGRHRSFDMFEQLMLRILDSHFLKSMFSHTVSLLYEFIPSIGMYSFPFLYVLYALLIFCALRTCVLHIFCCISQFALHIPNSKPGLQHLSEAALWHWCMGIPHTYPLRHLHLQGLIPSLHKA